MSEIAVEVAKIAFYPPSKGYAVLLREMNGGGRQLPVIVGAFEAQAIALALEGIEMPRPMTHDLLSNLIENLEVDVKRIVISDLRDGTFFAKIVIDSYQFGGNEIDSRPSDAIALALRVEAPILVDSSVLDEAGVEATDDDEDFELPIQSRKNLKEISLEEQLERAIEIEDYEKAAALRDMIKSTGRAGK